ncbi:MAG: NADH-quinone oxidoreductase subunit NuoG [Gammaproteobacteria bacterium]|nr:NADH-quinone oxidoreductase subunit NuoG [Gammaproteobacteria bacterium]
MSARPDIPADDAVNIEIDGRPYQARKGAMIIEVADEAGITIPRFCYHKKLSIAANCRMCMVEVEKVPKPLPACATPVAEGMKVFTRSDIATGGQKAVMEFLLINHPLDCPICDQGGECELQDLALGYGRDISRFAEKKRVVRDKYIGPLIATDMTRCIHCTRCIRMLREVAGKMELGATGRGEHMEIGTYIEKSLASELSGNVIDVCPVGALTSRPFRYKARAWELQQHASVAPHDAVGSNLFVHTRRGQVMRVVPREHEEINEVWLSDRDRFSYEGLYSDDRVSEPMIKVDGEWQAVDWETALQATVDGIRGVIDAHGADQVGMLVSPTATLEEMVLAQSLARGIGVNNIDHRLRQSDFTDQAEAPLTPSLGQPLAALEAVNAALVIGANVRKDQPIIGHRLRKAALAGSKVMFVNPVDYEFLFDVHAKAVVPPAQLAATLAGIAACFPDAANHETPAVKSAIGKAAPDDAQRRIAAALKDADNACVLLGSVAVNHPQYSLIRALAQVIAERSHATLGLLPDAANSAGGWLAGVLPHRGPAGSSLADTGLHAHAMLAAPLHAYLLFNVEPGHDCYDAAAAGKAIESADFVVSISPFAGEATRSAADVLLPIGPFTETSGTFVNAEGRWQSFAGVATPVGESRPGWKVLRVLANQFGLDGFEQTGTEQIRDALRAQCSSIGFDNRQAAGPVAGAAPVEGLQRVGDVAILATDPLVRRAVALQSSPDAEVAALLRISPATAETAGVREGYRVRVGQGEAQVEMDVSIDARVADGCVWIQSGTTASAALGPAFGAVTVERV